MKRMLAIAALATFALGGCAMGGGDSRALVPGINHDTSATPIASVGMWRLQNGVIVPMGYAPEKIAEDQIVVNSGAMAPRAGMVR